MSFISSFQHALDDKNRLMIPRKVREQIDETRDGAGFYMTRGLESCLALYTPTVWQELEKGVMNLSGEEFRNTDRRKFRRQFYGNAEYVTMDRQGRILVAERLKKLAGIERDVMLVGVGDHVELWDLKKWQAFMEESGDQYEQFASRALPDL